MKEHLSVKTVFIIGAGCSMPYGFPSGPALVDLIIDNPLVFAASEQLHATYLVSIDRRARLLLKRSKFPSIDQFLEKVPEFHDWGRVRVAKLLLEYEASYRDASGNLSSRSEGNAGIKRLDWLEYLYSNYLACPLVDFDKHQVVFVTYNYDRLIQFILFDAMFAVHSADDASKAVQSIKVLHLHGSLGALFDSGCSSEQVSIDFGARSSPTMLKRLSRNWQFVWERSNTNPAFVDAARHIAEAARVIVMGVGAATEVLSQLVAQAIAAGENAKRRREVHVCNFGLLGGETQRLRQALVPLCRGSDKRTLYNADDAPYRTDDIPVVPIMYGTNVNAITALREMPPLNSIPQSAVYHGRPR